MKHYRAIIRYHFDIVLVEGQAVSWVEFVGKARSYADTIFEYEDDEDNLYVGVVNISRPDYILI